MLSVKQRLNIVVLSIGLLVFYSLVGILQERIFRRGYGDENEKFTFSITFVSLQCVFYSIFARALLLTHEHAPNETPQGFYSISAVFLAIGLVTSNSALRFIPYPCQVVGKALKPIPVMLFGCCVGGKSYSLQKYIFVLMIVSGAVMFFYKPQIGSQDELTLGYILVGISLLMNGFMAGVQEKMRSSARPSPLNLMLFMNSWASAFLIIGVIVSGEFPSFLEFSTKHPEILLNIGAILIVGGFGQIFTCTMITSYGVVPCCIVLTIRKFFSVFLSVILYGNSLSIMQWAATALIFTTLLSDTILSLKLSTTDGRISLSVEENQPEVENPRNLVITAPNLTDPMKVQEELKR